MLNAIHGVSAPEPYATWKTEKARDKESEYARKQSDAKVKRDKLLIHGPNPEFDWNSYPPHHGMSSPLWQVSGQDQELPSNVQVISLRGSQVKFLRAVDAPTNFSTNHPVLILVHLWWAQRWTWRRWNISPGHFELKQLLKALALTPHGWRCKRKSIIFIVQCCTWIMLTHNYVMLRTTYEQPSKTSMKSEPTIQNRSDVSTMCKLSTHQKPARINQNWTWMMTISMSCCHEY